ncbi:uncharacterized protein LOC114420536 [Glycine soja]|uniref:uncharacterized protein n=1 Tax=Glycine max TaxID=3847 RepID=UPI0003DEA335|nr:uncharacterized protein LOC102668393 [Glycine max]XP_028242207.1 uncharacterized protein LOC114420536 [Glycine soja]|eukprot:XP_006584328.1 uncharacterized protein LOC102668393 [Glycine max]
MGADNLLRRCVTSEEAKGILWHCHNSPCGRHYGGSKTAAKVEMEHKAYWALKFLNFDEKASREHRKIQLLELEEMRLTAYESSRLYKEKVKMYHDKKLLKREFKLGQEFDLTVQELYDPQSQDPERTWVVNGQRLKLYHGNEFIRTQDTVHLIAK